MLLTILLVASSSRRRVGSRDAPAPRRGPHPPATPESGRRFRIVCPGRDGSSGHGDRRLGSGPDDAPGLFLTCATVEFLRSTGWMTLTR